MRMQFIGYLLIAACMQCAVAEEDRLDMEGMSVIGNQELPKVLYIVPWKASTLPDLAEPPLESLINEALAPIEREVFRREVLYHDTMVSRSTLGK